MHLCYTCEFLSLNFIAFHFIFEVRSHVSHSGLELLTRENDLELLVFLPHKRQDYIVCCFPRDAGDGIQDFLYARKPSIHGATSPALKGFSYEIFQSDRKTRR